MTAARLLTEEERNEVYSSLSPHATVGEERLAFCAAQDAKTLRALRPIVEVAARGPCLGSFSDPVPCGHCATCQARELLAELDAQGKGKERT